jgi:hypothetical protein
MATLTVTELSNELEATPRMVRKFLRSITPVEEQPGKGGRWSIQKAQVRTLKKKFEDFKIEHVRTVEVPEDDEPETE